MANESVCKGMAPAIIEHPERSQLLPKLDCSSEESRAGLAHVKCWLPNGDFHWGAECIMYLSNLKSKPFWRVTRFGLSAAGLWHIMACAGALDAMFRVIVISHMRCRQSPVQSGTGTNLDIVRVNKAASIHMFLTCCGDMQTVLDSAARHLA